MARYSDIRRGQRLNQSLQNYVTYLTTPRTPNLNTRGARAAQRNVYIEPYGVDVATDEIFVVRSPVEGYNRLATLINGAGTQSQVGDTAGAKTPNEVAGFQPAKLVTFENATRSVTVATSDITQNRYLKYAGERYSCAFGKKTATDDLLDAIEILRAAAKARANLEINRVSVTVERQSQR